MSRTDDRPPTLDYASPRRAEPSAPPQVSGDPRVRYVSMLEIAGSAALFAVTFWMVEYECQRRYFFGGSGASLTGYDRVRAADGFDENLMIEGVILFVCTPAFLITQGLIRPAVAVRVRRCALLASAAAGAAFSLIRWGLYYALFAIGLDMSDGFDFLIAVLLAIVLAAAVSRYRWPRRTL